MRSTRRYQALFDAAPFAIRSPPREIARRLGISRTTVQRNLHTETVLRGAAFT
ncbi:hypothetical protein GN109_17150 [Collimonas pratensis]|uniref:helix-turn-helix domain-containing protein n=1 Tax=Collimonas pratensis TaxID=279113 RepID=UPI00143E0190|nr:hypothetical protein [Collimonas pratensis]